MKHALHARPAVPVAYVLAGGVLGVYRPASSTQHHVAGRLSVLLDYISALLVVPGHQPEAKSAIEAVCSIVAAVGERYRQQKDLLSLVLLYESTQAGACVADCDPSSVRMFQGANRAHTMLSVMVGAFPQQTKLD